MTDQRPRYRMSDGKGYCDLMREALAAYWFVDTSALDGDDLLEAQRIVNLRQRRAWLSDAIARAIEHGHGDDPYAVLDLLSRSDFRHLYGAD